MKWLIRQRVLWLALLLWLLLRAAIVVLGGHHLPLKMADAGSMVPLPHVIGSSI